MEKFSQEWREKFMKNLSEKYKFLMSSELKNYDIFEVSVYDVEIRDEEIEGYEVDVRVDYLGSCDFDAYSISNMMKKVSEEIQDFVYKHHLDPKTFKFTQTDVPSVIVNEPTVLEFKYVADEKHEFYLGVNVRYDIK